MQLPTGSNLKLFKNIIVFLSQQTFRKECQRIRGFANMFADWLAISAHFLKNSHGATLILDTMLLEAVT